MDIDDPPGFCGQGKPNTPCTNSTQCGKGVVAEDQVLLGYMDRCLRRALNVNFVCSAASQLLYRPRLRQKPGKADDR